MALPKDLGGGGQAPLTPESVEVTRAQNRVDAQRVTSTSYDMLPEEDFSDKAVRSREHQADMRAAQLANYYYQQANRSGGPVQQVARAKAASIMAAATKRNNGSLLKYPTLVKAVIESSAAGTPLDEKDLLRLSNFASVDQAADMYMNAPDETRRRNIYLSMNPVMRAAMMDVVGEKVAQGLNAMETADQNVLVQGIVNAGSAVMAPFTWANETAQHAFRAGLAATDTGNTAANVATGMALSLNPFSSVVNFAGGMWANWDATENGKFDETYINTLKASGKYKPVEVDVVAAIAKATANGDPDPITTVMLQMGDQPGVEETIRRLIYRPEQTPELMELARQVDSANLGSSGQMYYTHFTTADSGEFSDYRGLRGREVGANSASIFYTFALDPTVAGSKVLGAYRVARFALTKLAPGKSAAVALASTKVAGKEMNPVRVYFSKFTDDLSKVDDLEKAGDRTAAAALRQQMARQYPELPQDVVQTLREEGVRTVDDFAAFIDDTNDAYLIAHGKPASWAAQLEKGIPAGYESSLSEVPLFERMYEAGDMGRRGALMPRMTVGRRMRQQASRYIGRHFMPEGRSKAVIDKFYGTGSTEDVIAGLEPLSGQMGIGTMDQAVLGGSINQVMGRRVDGITRLFSSLPNKGQIYTGDARDAQVFYKFARSFLTKRHSDLLTAAFKDANPGQRRLLVAGVIRTAAGARGVALGKDDVLHLIDDMATGTRKGELYSATQSKTVTGAVTAGAADSPLVKTGTDVWETENGLFRVTSTGGKLKVLSHEGDGVYVDYADVASLDEAQAVIRSGIDTANPNAAMKAAESTIQYRPSSVNGQEHALHLWQTTDAVHIPSIREMESLKAYRMFMGQWKAGEVAMAAPQAVTDAWSFGTLYGLRFALRSAVEDLWSYAATAGRLPYLVMGRRASTALRDARPNLEVRRYTRDIGGHKKGDVWLDDDGNVQIVVKSRLGMFNKRLRKAGDAADNGASVTSQIIGMMMLGNLDEQAILKATKAAHAGDWGPTRELIGEALTRQKLTGLKPQDIEDFKDLAATSFGLKQMDELAETSRYINQGGYPVFADPTDVPGVTDVMLPAKPATIFGDFIDVPNGDPNFGLFWFRNIQGVAEHDGVIGKLAIANLEQPALARKAVADAIREDTKFGYKDKFSALYTGQLTVDEFAQRYVDDVLHMFTGSDGALNMKLLDRIAPVGDDGWRRVDLYETVEGKTVAKITPQSMNGYRKHGAPDYALGQQAIPMPKDDTGLLSLFDKGWGWMGEQYARIAREPVFLANYKEQRQILREYEQSLADVMGPDAARAVTAKMASDRAYGFTLSYVDNPTNRSQMAWKVRNVSRYYRATEDFYRRFFRMAKNYPEGFWKTALTYQALDDTGYVFTDDNGDKYFAYPGNEFLQSAVRTVMGPLFGGAEMNIEPFIMGGKVKMLAPSSDPNQALPQVMGPLGVWSVKGLFALPIFKQFDGLERYIVGEYAVNQSWYQMLLPASVTRALNGLSDDERTSMYGNAVMDAFAIAAANDMIPATRENGAPIENLAQLQTTPQWSAIERIAWAGVVTKALMGYVVPASPQMYVNNVTDFARAHGVTSMRSQFLKIVKAKAAAGSVNPVGDAFTEWWKLNPKGDLMPFTVSKTMNTPDSVNTLADVQANKNLKIWYRDNEALYREFPNGALFLAPRDGEFSWGSWSLMTDTLGLKTEKGFDQFVVDAMAAKTQSESYATIADYQQDIDKLDPNDPAQAAQITELEKQKKADLDALKAENPWWALKYATDNNWQSVDKYTSIAYNDTKNMVDAMEERGVATAASTKIREAILTYEDYMSDIKGLTGSTDAEDAQKRAWKLQLAADLRVIGSEDPNASVFIENVLMNRPEMRRVK